MFQSVDLLVNFDVEVLVVNQQDQEQANEPHSSSVEAQHVEVREVQSYAYYQQRIKKPKSFVQGVDVAAKPVDQPACLNFIVEPQQISVQHLRKHLVGHDPAILEHVEHHQQHPYQAAEAGESDEDNQLPDVRVDFLGHLGLPRVEEGQKVDLSVVVAEDHGRAQSQQPKEGQVAPQVFLHEVVK